MRMALADTSEEAPWRPRLTSHVVPMLSISNGMTDSCEKRAYWIRSHYYGVARDFLL
jgi:hypothetical protein